MTRWGFIYSLGDEGTPWRIDELGSPVCTLVCVGIPKLEDAPVAARKLLDDGVQLIELCGAFGGAGLAAVVEAVEGRCPVGGVFYGGEAAGGLQRLFG